MTKDELDELTIHRYDQYRDALWRLLVSANEAAGDVAAARRSQERYDAVLRDLGV